MRPLPRVPFVGRLCRLKSDEPFIDIARRAAASASGTLDAEPVEGTKWLSLWLNTPLDLKGSGIAPDSGGMFRYPYLLRAVENRILLAGVDGSLAMFLIERGGIGGRIESPRIQVDRFARELIQTKPRALVEEFDANDRENIPPDGTRRVSGRKYIIGAIYAAVDGYGRALRSISFFGDDLAEAELVRHSLSEITVTRIGIRDPKLDKDLLSISSVGDIDFRYRGVQHLTSIDHLTSHMRLNRHIEWREGVSWQPETSPLAAKAIGRKANS